MAITSSHEADCWADFTTSKLTAIRLISSNHKTNSPWTITKAGEHRVLKFSLNRCPRIYAFSIIYLTYEEQNDNWKSSKMNFIEGIDGRHLEWLQISSDRVLMWTDLLIWNWCRVILVKSRNEKFQTEIRQSMPVGIVDQDTNKRCWKVGLNSIRR